MSDNITAGGARVARLILALALAIMPPLSGCGGGSVAGKLPVGAPPVPQPSDPWFGTAGNALISDQGHDLDGKIDYIWIGFNSQAQWQNFLTLCQKAAGGGFWIGGPVVVTSSNAVGFYFDPASTAAAEVTAEGLQTNLDTIKKDPAEAAKTPLGRWDIPTAFGITPCGIPSG